MGQIAISQSQNPLTIQGQGARSTTITGSATDRIFDVYGNVTIVGVTMTGGNTSTSGGALYGESGSAITLNLDQLTNNTVSSAGNSLLLGGAIVADGALTITSSTLSDNHVKTTGPGNASGGAIVASSGLSMTNVTISGNSASVSSGVALGGGLVWAGSGTAMLTNVTLASNTATSSSGPSYAGNVGSQHVPLQWKNSIIAYGTATYGSNCAQGSSTDFSSAGGNVESTTPSQCGLAGPADKVGFDPGLQPLGNNGGQTDTRALLSTSPASDFTSCAQASDQRGFPRPDVGGESSACDSGAYEFQESNGSGVVPIGGTGGSGGTGSGGGSGGAGGSGGTGGPVSGTSLTLVSGVTKVGTTVQMSVTCEGQAGDACQTTEKLTTTETLKGQKLVALSARARKHRRVVVVGVVHVTVAVGQTVQVTVRLNGKGKRLLAKRGRLPVTLHVTETVDAQQSPVLSRKLTFGSKHPRRRHRHH